MFARDRRDEVLRILSNDKVFGSGKLDGSGRLIGGIEESLDFSQFLWSEGREGKRCIVGDIVAHGKESKLWMSSRRATKKEVKSIFRWRDPHLFSS